MKITAIEMENKFGLIPAVELREKGSVLWQGVNYQRAPFLMPGNETLCQDCGWEGPMAETAVLSRFHNDRFRCPKCESENLKQL